MKSENPFKAGSICDESRSERRTLRKLWEVSTEGDFNYLITLNLEFTSACQRSLSHLHWSILTWQDEHTFSMYCRKIVSTIIRTSAWIELCRIHGQGSWSSLYWARKLPPGFLWSGWRLTKISSNYQTCFSVAWNLAWHVKSSNEEGEAALQRSKTERFLLHRSRRWRM